MANKIFWAHKAFPHCLQNILIDHLVILWICLIGSKVVTIPSQAKPQWKTSEICQLENWYPEKELKGTDLCLNKELVGCMVRDAKMMGFFSQNIFHSSVKYYFKNQLIDLIIHFQNSLRRHQETKARVGLFREVGSFYSLIMWISARDGASSRWRRHLNII